ncbi:MAG TPA: hypothetical protein PLE57_04890 [Methanoregulaceae archaeon]|nr:hypothetical protein [Methanoregulaceae archaeon]
MLWREEDDVRVEGQKICPIMSGPRGMVLCQGKHCAAACPRNHAGETYWFCEIIEERQNRAGCRHDQCLHSGGQGP